MYVYNKCMEILIIVKINTKALEFFSVELCIKLKLIACFSVYCYFSQFPFVVIKISVLNYLLNYRLRLFLNKPCCKENDIHIALKNVYVEIKNTCSFLFSCFQR